MECPLCQLTVEVMQKILSNPKVDHDVEHVLEKTCRGVPVQYREKVRNTLKYLYFFTAVFYIAL